MPINIAANGPIPNPGPINANIRNDFYQCVRALTYATLWQGPGTIVSIGTARIDMQGNIAGGGKNLQGQINGVHGASTFSCALVAGTLSPPNVPDPANQRYVLNRVQTALGNSENHVQIWNVTGTSP